MKIWTMTLVRNNAAILPWFLRHSAESFYKVPGEFDLVLIDGCHCVNHVILDTLHYGAKVKPSGFLMFHDTAAHLQQTMRDPHGPDHPMFYNSVLQAHRLMGFPSAEWKLVMDVSEPSSKIGGMQVFQKQ